MTNEQQAQSLYETFTTVTQNGITPYKWEELPDFARDGWLAVLAKAKEMDDHAQVVTDSGEGMPLRAVLENDRLCVSIGVKTLAFAFENSEENNPYYEDFCDTKRQFSICDPLQFAKDVCNELNREYKDGSTPLTQLLDSMMGSVAEQGSEGVTDPDEEDDD